MSRGMIYPSYSTLVIIKSRKMGKYSCWGVVALLKAFSGNEGLDSTGVTGAKLPLLTRAFSVQATEGFRKASEAKCNSCRAYL